MPFFAIAAMSENRVIGNQGKIPWHIPEDFRWFKHKTMGGTLIMGRKTFESIGKPLPGRRTLILSRQANPTFDQPTYTFKSLFDDYVANHIGETFWVCGGGEIYRQLLDHCGYLYITTVKKRVEGDILFPPESHQTKTHCLDQLIYDTLNFRVERWKLRTLPPEFAIPPEKWPFTS